MRANVFLFTAMIALPPATAAALPGDSKFPHLPTKWVCSVREPSQRSEAEMQRFQMQSLELADKMRKVPEGNDGSAERERLLKSTIALSEAEFGCESGATIHALEDYASELRTQERFVEALDVEHRALNLMQDSNRAFSYEDWGALINITRDAGRPAEALVYAQQAVETFSHGNTAADVEYLREMRRVVVDLREEVTEEEAHRVEGDSANSAEEALSKLKSLDQSNETVLRSEATILEQQRDFRSAETIWRKLADYEHLSNNLALQERYREAAEAGTALIEEWASKQTAANRPRTPDEKKALEFAIAEQEASIARLEAAGKKDEAALGRIQLAGIRQSLAGTGMQDIRTPPPDWGKRVQVARWFLLVNEPVKAATLLQPTCVKLAPTLEDQPDALGWGGNFGEILIPSDCFAVLAVAEAAQARSGIDETSKRAFEAAQAAVDSASGLALARAVGRKYVVARGGSDLLARIDRASADSISANSSLNGAEGMDFVQKLIGMTNSSGGLAPGKGSEYSALMWDMVRRSAVPVEVWQKAESEKRLAFTELGKRFPAYQDIVAPKPLAMMSQAQGSRDESVSELLAADEAMVLWMVPLGAEHGLVFVISHQNAAWAKISLTGDEIDAMVSELRRQIDPCGYGVGGTDCDTDTPAFHRETAWKLFQALLGDQGLQAVWNAPGIHSLLIVPSGSVTSLPPGVLLTAPPNPKGGDDTAETLRDESWLIRSKAIAILPSVSALRTLRVVLPAIRKGARPNGGLFMIADPDFGGGAQQPPSCQKRSLPHPITSYYGTPPERRKALASLCRLPGTRVEAAQLKAQVPGVVLTDGNAREAELRLPANVKAIGSARIVAFASHALLAGDAGNLEPALALAAPRKDEVDDDGLLTASKAAGLRLSADWVILSACNTASPDMSPGARGLSGLARGFFYAGAKNLLVSHWRTDDDLSGVIVNEVIRLERTGLTKTEALRRASVEMLDRKLGPPGDRTAHPRAWAPFVVIGDGQ